MYHRECRILGVRGGRASLRFNLFRFSYSRYFSCVKFSLLKILTESFSATCCRAMVANRIGTDSGLVLVAFQELAMKFLVISKWFAVVIKEPLPKEPKTNDCQSMMCSKYVPM